MFPFWESVIAPLIKAADAKRIVEIGALRGETTTLLLNELGADAQLHVIDPLPQFDPTEHERRFGGRYVFHRALSHDALPGLAAMDVALIDGDHNWYTVHGELELLEASSRREQAMLPLLVMHDVLWPYGRRDLYYEPGRIPADRRQPYREAGMEPGHSELLKRGGINPLLANAVTEGGPRNGVMTALDDFLKAHDEPTRTVIVPIYFGLAIVAEQRRLDANPALAAEFERLESAELRGELLELAEELRLRSVFSEHTAVYGDLGRTARSANRFLDTVRTALLDEHQIENEVRLEYLAWCAVNRRDPDPLVMRDPATHLQRKLDRLERSRASGAMPKDAVGVPFYPQTSLGHDGFAHLRQCLDSISRERVQGDLLDVGTGRGGAAIYMRAHLEAHEIREPVVWIADEFRGPDVPVADPADANQMADLNMISRAFAKFRLFDERVRFLQGVPEQTLAAAPIDSLALVRVDARRADPVAALGATYERVSIGGRIVVENCEDAQRAALEHFRSHRGIADLLVVDGSRVEWQKLAQPQEGSDRRPVEGDAIAPMPAPVAGEPCDLSVIVVFHNMRREAKRTLRSLSRTYQSGIENLDYEVIVVDNGSSPDQLLGEEMVAGFGPEFRYVDLGSHSSPSPAAALNRGIETARGESLALMIDGAHMLTPGLLRYAMQGLREYEPAMVATQQWYLGPGQQVETIKEGYDRRYEDSLLDRIDWPSDGYRLFEVGHFIGARDWFDGMWESNCLFFPRSAIKQIGSIDEGFSIAGGGYANLDLFERIGSLPGLRMVTVLGEGSFHQLHGGTTTNETDDARRVELLAAYKLHYEELRGKPYRTLAKPFHYVGSFTEAARRTRPRRMGAGAFRDTAGELVGDQLPDQPAPMAEDLQREFVDAYWRSMRWRQGRWLGHPLPHAPADLIAYQQMICERGPGWLVETGRGEGGRALFLASICELVGHGEVLSIGRPSERLPEHPRIRWLDGDPLEPAVAAKAHEIVGAADAMVVLGRALREDLMVEFELYSKLVPVGSWVVLEDTIIDGNPIWPGMGPGPAEAVGRIRKAHPEFEPDPAMAQLTPSFNSNGYLKRKR